MKIAVCDDDRTTKEQIASLIREHKPDAEVITFEAGEELLKSQENFEISFLDVEMKEVSGIDVAKHMREEQEKRGKGKSIIIFVTGYREYMEDAFDVNAFHYLLKPIDEKKFNTVFNRALKEISVKAKQEGLSVIIKNNGMQKKVLLRDIYYIESSNKKVVFHTKDGKIDTYGRMDDWETELGDSFYRCHFSNTCRPASSFPRSSRKTPDISDFSLHFCYQYVYDYLFHMPVGYGRHCIWLGKRNLFSLGNWRIAYVFSRYSRRIYRKDLFGNERTSKIYY